MIEPEIATGMRAPLLATKTVSKFFTWPCRAVAVAHGVITLRASSRSG